MFLKHPFYFGFLGILVRKLAQNRLFLQEIFVRDIILTQNGSGMRFSQKLPRFEGISKNCSANRIWGQLTESWPKWRELFEQVTSRLTVVFFSCVRKSDQYVCLCVTCPFICWVHEFQPLFKNTFAFFSTFCGFSEPFRTKCPSYVINASRFRWRIWF